MKKQLTLTELRYRLEANLRKWIPGNERLVGKELALFDRLVTRRDFLKGTSLATLALLVDGCGNGSQGGPPSQWNETEGLAGLVSDAEIASVAQPAGIVVDADVFKSSGTYNPIAAPGSTDAVSTVGHAVIESYNAHIMTAKSYSEFDQTGLKKPDRTYGVSELVHLRKESGADYVLAFYEKNDSNRPGLGETLLTLEGTASQTYNRLVATNGNFHNKIRHGRVVDQKMVMLADVGVAKVYGDTTLMPLRLYYQNRSHALLQPGVTPEEASTGSMGIDMSEVNIIDGISFWKPKPSDWNTIDLIEHFRRNEPYTFVTYRVLEVDTYHDGANHTFIYGTVLFDDFYSYGFVVTFNEATAGMPTVRFFAPEFLSVKSATIADLRKEFDAFNNTLIEPQRLERFAVFEQQRFRPLVQSVDMVGNTVDEVLFSFLSYNLAANDPRGFSEPLMLRFFGTEEAFVNRYLIAVETFGPAVSYLLPEYEPTVSIVQEQDGRVHLTFDTGTIPTVDIWGTLFGRNTKAFADAYVRSVNAEVGSMTILLATSHFDGQVLGVAHKSLTLNHLQGSWVFTIPESPHDARVDFEACTFDSAFDGKTMDYHQAWYDTMGDYLNTDTVISTTLAEVVVNNGGQFDFYCTQNHQGILRSYYVIESVNSDSSVNRMLIGFNEAGIDSTNDLGEETLSYQDHETLRQQIETGTTLHYPPSPIALNPHEMLCWYGLEEDGEVLYTSAREYAPDAVTRTLQTNIDLQLLSYVKATCNRYSKSWISSELQKQIPTGADFKNYVFQRDLHQLHLHVTNAYSSTVNVDEDTFVEIRFDKRLAVTDYTDPDKAVRHEVGPLSSLFLQPDASGRIALEVDIGDDDAKYIGAMMQYRFLSKKTLEHLSERPVAFVPDSSAMMANFMTCNISFRMYERFNTDNYQSIPVGAPQEQGSVHAKLTSYATIDDAVASEIANAYGTISTVVTPLNDVMALTADAAILGHRHHCCRHLKHRFDSWARHAAHKVVTAAEKRLEEAKKKAEEALSNLSKTVTDIIADIDNDVVSPAVDGVERLANAIEKVINEAVAFVKMLWEWLMGTLDFKTAFEIGQELRSLFTDQLKAGSGTNLYSFLKDAENFLDNKVEDLGNEIDKGIDHIFKTSGDYDKNGARGRSDHANSIRHSSRIFHVMDQFGRLMKKLDIDKLLKKIDGCSPTELANAPFVQSLESAAGSFVDLKNPAQFFYFPGMKKGFSEQDKQGLFNEIKANTGNVFGDVSKFLNGTAQYETIKDNLELSVKNTATAVVGEIDTLTKDLSKVPGQILDDVDVGNLSKCIDPSGGVFKDILEVFGLLLFSNKDKFKDMEELVLFLFGELVVLASLLIQTMLDNGLKAIKDMKADFGNLTDYLKGQFRTDLNNLAKNLYLPGKNDPNLTRITNDTKIIGAVVTLVADILDALAVLGVGIIGVINAFDLKNILTNVVNAVFFLLRICLKVPGVVIAVINAVEAIFNEIDATDTKEKAYYGALLGAVLSQTLASIIGTVFIIINFFMLLLKPFFVGSSFVQVFTIVAIVTLLVSQLFSYAAFSLQVAIQATMEAYGHLYGNLAALMTASIATFAVNIVLDFVDFVLQVLILVMGYLLDISDTILEIFDEEVWPIVAIALAEIIIVVLKIVDILVKNIRAWAKVAEDVNAGLLLLQKDGTTAVAGVYPVGLLPMAATLKA